MSKKMALLRCHLIQNGFRPIETSRMTLVYQRPFLFFQDEAAESQALGQVRGPASTSS